ncbi:sugar ABC transporter permease [Paenibacillus antri]|uniref:Sugar ABC transporter permease n=1 Tax=Paenibacillus antri TaxID=2582848 RepID=A0A5R9FZN3_9BACL|nr:sugar ABC transporter permease [Paenibacillus antri]TLS49527.1 sugar ABC transporter permease [Paenibacillus antri]
MKNKKRYNNGTAYLMLSPVVIMLSIFVVIPLIYAIRISFYDWSFYQDPVFVGFRNFYLVLTDDRFYTSIGVGLKFVLLVVPVQLVLAFLFAHVVRAMGRKASSFVKTSIYIPTIISGIITAIIFQIIYNFDGGVLNAIIGSFGFEKVGWLVEKQIVLFGLAIPAIWLGFGITALIMLAGLLDIPESYYEAASLEGASAIQKMFHITIPLLKNVAVYLLVTGFVGAIQQLELPLFLTNGGPSDATLLPNFYIFEHFRNDLLMGHTIAAALLLFVVLGSISAIIFRVINSEKAIDE